MRRFKKPLIGLGLAFLACILLGFFALPPILKSVLVKKLTASLHREVTIEKIKFNPFTLAISVQGFKVKERASAETFAACDELFLDLQSLSALKQELILREIRVRQPYLRIVRNTDGSYNFSDLLEKKPSGGPAPEKAPAGGKDKENAFHFSLNNIQIQGGKIDFSDKGPQKEHTVRDLHLAVPSLANTPQRVEIFVQPALGLTVNGTPYELRGKTKPFADSMETMLEIEFKDLDIPFYLAYLPFKMDFRVASAALDAKAQIIFLRSKDKPPSVTIKGELAIKNVEIHDREGKSVFRLSRLDLSIASAEPLAKIVHLAKIAIQSPELEIRRNPDGTFNLENLFPGKGKTEKKAEPDGNSSAFAVEIDEIGLSGGKIAFADFSGKKPFMTTLSPMDVKIVHFSNGKDKKTEYSVSLATEAKESARLQGELSVQPLRGEGTLELKAVSLPKYSPYYADQIHFAVADGFLDLSTRYQFSREERELPVLLNNLSLSLRTLLLKKAEGKEEFLRIPLLTVRETAVDLSRKELRVGRVSTEKGIIGVTRLQDGTIDLMELFPPASKKTGENPAPDSGPPWAVTLGRLALDQYTVRVKDLAPAAPMDLAVEKIRVSGENLSTRKGQKGTLTLSFLLDQRTTLSAQNTLSLDPLQVDGTAEIKHLPFRPYSPYYQDRILFQVEAGEMELQTQYRYAKGEKGSEIKISELSSSLSGLQLRKTGEPEPFLLLPLLAVKGASLDANKKEIVVREISTRNGDLRVQRSKGGAINLSSLLAPAPEGPGAEKGPPPRDPKPPGARPEKEIPAVGEKPWVFKIGKLAVDQYQVKVDDRFPAEPAALSIRNLELLAEDFSTAPGQKAKAALTLRLNEKGSVSLKGSVGICPLAADLKVALQGISIEPLQPYFTDQVNLAVTDGNVSATGALTLKNPGGAGWQVRYQGEAAMSSFASIDKITEEDFLNWESLALSGMDVGINPLVAHIDGIALSKFYSRLIIRPDGSLNLQNILKKAAPAPQAAAPAPFPAAPAAEKMEAPPSRAQDIKIARVTLQGGQIDFSDHYIQPNYSARLTEVGGRISDIDAAEMRSGDTELRGMWDSTEPVEITGKVNPVARDLFVDLSVKMKDIELSPFSPYLGKYAGYTIQKGKLAMDLKYLIVKKKLEAGNKIFFDQLTLGARVESPQATKLPVKFAISLLKDRNGEIHLDIPVNGSLDDPKFSVFRIVLQVIVNLLAKAVTSPFSLVSALVGGGEQLEYAQFAYGTAEVQGEALNKLNTMAKVLQDRPEIRLDLEGYADLEKDREALKTLFFQRKLKTQKLKETAGKGKASIPLDEIKIEAGEVADLLKKAYKAEKFPKPKNLLGFEKDIPAPEMEKLVLTHLEIKDGDLRDLAVQRSRSVKDFLVHKGGIGPERIFLLEAKSLSPEKKEKIKDSRVDFKLK